VKGISGRPRACLTGTTTQGPRNLS